MSQLVTPATPVMPVNRSPAGSDTPLSTVTVNVDLLMANPNLPSEVPWPSPGVMADQVGQQLSIRKRSPGSSLPSWSMTRPKIAALLPMLLGSSVLNVPTLDTTV